MRGSLLRRGAAVTALLAVAAVAFAGSMLAPGPHDCVFPGWTVGVAATAAPPKILVGLEPLVECVWDSVSGRYVRPGSLDCWEFDNPNVGDVTYFDYPEPPASGPPTIHQGRHN